MTLRSLMRRVRNRAYLVAQFVGVAQAAVGIAAHRGPKRSSARFCFAMSMAMPATAKVEALIAGLLRLVGHTSVVVPL